MIYKHRYIACGLSPGLFALYVDAEKTDESMLLSIRNQFQMHLISKEIKIFC